MKRNGNFILRCVADTWVLMPVGPAVVEFPGMIKLNEAGCFLWDLLETEQRKEALIQALVDGYEVTPQQVAADLETFLEPLLLTGAVISTEGDTPLG